MASVGFVGFAGRLVACAIVLAASGCGPSEGGNSLGNTAGPVAAPRGEALNQVEWDRQWEAESARIVLPVDPRHLKLELTPGWLEGYWVDQKAACYGSDSGIHFGADGRWRDHEVEGRFAIRAATIELRALRTHDGESPPDDAVERFTARLAGPNEIDTVWADGADGRLYRCPPGGLSE